MKKTLIAALATFVFSGCATSTGIIPAGDGVYYSSKQGGASMNWSGGLLKAELIKDADKFCGQSGKTLQVMSSHSSDATLYTYPSAELNFRCR